MILSMRRSYLEDFFDGMNDKLFFLDFFKIYVPTEKTPAFAEK